MKLHESLLRGLADMVVGDNALFPYRSSYFVTQFFKSCGLPFVHDGTGRARWAADRLSELNAGLPSTPGLPASELVTVFTELFDPYRFDEAKKEIAPALESFNALLKRSGLVASLDDAGRFHLKHSGTGVSCSTSPRPRPLSPEETEQRLKLAGFLDTASEDELTEKMLVPFFLRLGFHRVSATGHTEKILEFGKDLWTKYQLPTGHWLYFCAQIKRDKIDSSGAGKGNNVATVLNQALMAIGHPIFDPDTNRKVLLDHLFIISAGEITKAAREWLVGQLDSRRDHRRWPAHSAFSVRPRVDPAVLHAGQSRRSQSDQGDNRISGLPDVIIVEGYFGTFAVHQAGYPAVVAVMGSTLSAHQADLVARCFDRVCLMLDGDEAGRLGATTIALTLASRMSVSTIILEDGKQPDQLAPREIQRLLIAPRHKGTMQQAKTPIPS